MQPDPIFEESHLQVLRLLDSNPAFSQRDLARALGVSLGKTNYCVRALLNRGLIKLDNFRNNHNKMAYAYLLTPAGIAAKAELTRRFLKIKMRENAILKKEIDQLRTEMNSPSAATKEMSSWDLLQSPSRGPRF